MRPSALRPRRAISAEPRRHSESPDERALARFLLRIWPASNTSITFYRSGFAVRPSPTYAELMTQTDSAGTTTTISPPKPASSFSRTSVKKPGRSRRGRLPDQGDSAVGAYLKEHTRRSPHHLSMSSNICIRTRWRRSAGASRRSTRCPSTFIRSSSRDGGGFVSISPITVEVKTAAGSERRLNRRARRRGEFLAFSSPRSRRSRRKGISAGHPCSIELLGAVADHAVPPSARR